MELKNYIIFRGEALSDFNRAKIYRNSGEYDQVLKYLKEKGEKYES